MDLLSPARILSLALAFAGVASSADAAEKVFRLATTLADIPTTTGQPNQGAEGVRVMGITLYDALTNWDLSYGDRSPELVPGLAVSWSIDPADKTVWTFKLRKGVTFHDGSKFDAKVAAWNFAKVMDKTSPQYDQAQATQALIYFQSIESVTALDNDTLQIKTKIPDAILPYLMTQIFMSSPARWEEMGRDWAKVAQKPSGTGPWKLDSVVPRERAELVRNGEYWNEARRPKSDRMILFAMPDATTRVAALLAGQVDMIEAPPPDTLERLKQAGQKIVTNIYPHVWPYMLSMAPGSPFLDLRIRKAANLAIDREGLVKFLKDTAVPAKGMVNPTHPWFGHPSFDIKYDPKAALAIMKEAGYSPEKPLKVKLLISTSGSGQMQPLPMNEFIQENMREVGFDVAFEVVEWETLRTRRRMGADAPENKGVGGLNNSSAFWDPNIALVGQLASTSKPPYNWGRLNDPVVDQLANAARAEFDPAKQSEILAKMHAYVVDQSYWIWVVHDVNPRAMSAKVKGFVQAQSWWQDFTPVVVEP